VAIGIPDQSGLWEQRYQRDNYFGSSPSQFARKVVPYARRDGIKNVLELGCGQGRDSIYFVQNGFNVTANVLIPNGIFAFEVKSVNDVDYGKGVSIGDNFFNDNGHIRHFFSSDYIEGLLQKFKINNNFGMLLQLRYKQGQRKSCIEKKDIS